MAADSPDQDPPSTDRPDATGSGDGTQAKAPSQEKERDPLRGSRTSGLWAGVVTLGLVLVLLVIFITQNTQEVQVTFLGWSGRAPLSVALLVAALAGLFLAAISAMLRMWQVRRRVRRSSH